jgi:L-asparaginase II
VADPILIELTRGDQVESVHRVHCVVVDAQGKVQFAAGDAERLTFFRSSAKPLQALAMAESGAPERFGFTDRELAVMCASHHGAPMHVEAVTSILNKIGLQEQDLECGIHYPADGASAQALVRAGEPARKIHHNCSGKHASMLALCRQMGWPTRGYISPAHPAQQCIRQVVAEMTATPLPEVYAATDGCNAPVFAVPLQNMAHAFARLADPSTLSARRAAAACRLCHAMRMFPEMVAGTGDLTTNLMRVAGEHVVCKGGAEGVFGVGALAQGRGIALKSEDGSPRGFPVLIPQLLFHLGVIAEQHYVRLQELYSPLLHNTAGATIGTIRVRGLPVAAPIQR